MTKSKSITLKGCFFYVSLFISFILSIILSSYSLHAQSVSCTGAACPPSASLDAVGQTIAGDYLRKLADGFTSAHAIANLGAIPYIGGVSLGLFTVGGQAAIGLNRSKSEDLSNLTDAEVGGIIPIALFYGGMNLKLLKLIPAFSSLDFLNKTDIYFGQLNLKLNQSDIAKIDSLRSDLDATHIGVRYLVIENVSIPFLLTLQGLSLQFSYIQSSFKLKLEEDDDDDPYKRLNVPAGGVELGWLGENKLTVKSKAKSYAFSVNTGIRFLFFFSLTMGAGVAYHFSESEVRLERSGYLYLMSARQDANLTVDYTNRDGLESYKTFFYKMGFEFNIPFVRIGVEGTVIEKDLYGVSLGTRIDI